jgi:exopolyphosphatase / guanosine-5'-triphosphate,3'-diphosphate pyrophosphatase
MEKIIPRWEWRTFGQSFGEADEKFAALVPKDVQDSQELYFLSSVADENVKVRDQLMDIKALEQVNSDGLEQWKPVMKAGFPIASAEVTKVFAALGVTCPTPSRPAYTMEQFVEELVEPEPRLRRVFVNKRRSRYTIDGCMAEMTEVVADGKKIRTVALELEDPARVIATVRKVGLGGFKNINYPQGLKQLIGMKG